MTYDRQIDTDFTTAHADLRDKVGGMANWAVANDSVATGHLALSTDVAGWWIVIEANSMGDGSDSSSAYEIHVCDSYTDPSTYNSVEKYNVGGTYNGMSSTDSVQYWLQYTDSYGFMMYIRRNVGDSNDGSLYFGAMRYDGGAGTEYWDPRSSSSISGPMPYHSLVYRVDDSSWYFDSSQTTANHVNPKRASQEGDVRGLLNPDANFNNYVWWSNAVLYASDISDSDTNDSPIFARITDPIWMEDRSGTDVNTGDVAQDSGGSDEWEVVDYHGMRIAIRMI